MLPAIDILTGTSVYRYGIPLAIVLGVQNHTKLSGGIVNIGFYNIFNNIAYVVSNAVLKALTVFIIVPIIGIKDAILSVIKPCCIGFNTFIIRLFL
jgi:hypothetical protein